ncbi:MAG: class I SAM-dependent methyltransferase [Thaumarchaeota archaeon]|nr:class I SAM-dependent methyltransferase [Candidatus Calditenuaceae archaeon]MDW8186676.1 class I SAM-dependent methyltransferase [Nitrososphaerota archaeon]
MGRRLNPFVPSPVDVIVRALQEAGLESESLMVDLGSGDGRASIIAAKEFGAKSAGIEIDELLVQYAERRRRAQGLRGVRFVRADARFVDLKSVDVVFAYLTTDALEAVKPSLLSADDETLVITHDYPIRGWVPTEVLRTWSDTTARHHVFYLYRLRDAVKEGDLRLSISKASASSARPLPIRMLFEDT